MAVYRAPENPIIKPADIIPSRDDLEVIGVFNAAVTRLNDEVILLLRIAEAPVMNSDKFVYSPIYDLDKKDIFFKEFDLNDPQIDFSDVRSVTNQEGLHLTSISHLKVARSKDGIHFDIEDSPALVPENEYEVFGIEDARISKIDDTYYVNYVAVSSAGVTTYLASTKDFKSYKRHGIMFCPDNKDVVVFPERINGKYYALHRPASSLFDKNDIWIAESPDLLCWGNHRFLISPSGSGWDSVKIGSSAVPFKTKAGWVEIYHGVDENNRYSLGGLLLDENEPWRVISRTKKPIFEPQTDYECNGFFGNVVFTCGLLFEDDKIKLYYGAADTLVCYAELDLEDLMTALN